MRCSILRTRSSGFVSLFRILCMRSVRVSFATFAVINRLRNSVLKVPQSCKNRGSAQRLRANSEPRRSFTKSEPSGMTTPARALGNSTGWAETAGVRHRSCAAPSSTRGRIDVGYRADKRRRLRAGRDEADHFRGRCGRGGHRGDRGRRSWHGGQIR